jgi:hypothetical protein
VAPFAQGTRGRGGGNDLPPGGRLRIRLDDHPAEVAAVLSDQRREPPLRPLNCHDEPSGGKPATSPTRHPSARSSHLWPRGATGGSDLVPRRSVVHGERVACAHDRPSDVVAPEMTPAAADRPDPSAATLRWLARPSHTPQTRVGAYAASVYVWSASHATTTGEPAPSESGAPSARRWLTTRPTGVSTWNCVYMPR